MKKVVQIVPSLLYGDAIGNEILALDKILKNAGYNAEIYAGTIDKRIPAGTAKTIDDFYTPNTDDTLIYHFGTGWDFVHKIKNFDCKKIFRYHNITHPDFFAPFDIKDNTFCKWGLLQMRSLAKQPDYCLAVSQFNKNDLQAAGYKCPIDVLPILIPFGDYDTMPSQKIIDKYKDDKTTNIIFVGRVSPNKKHEDIIAAFYMYQKFYNPKSRLFLVGSHSGKYFDCLKKYVDELGLKNVFFTGHIKFDEILAYYKIADLFLCQSEHEGFCVPLVEAMYFGVPIVAYDSTAIGDTMGSGGILLQEKNPLETAGVMNYVLTREDVKEQIRIGQKQTLQRFDNEKVEKRFLDCLEKFLIEEGIVTVMEEAIEKNTDNNSDKSYTNISRLVLEFAMTQYSVQWTKTGNLQTSAGSVLSLPSIVIAVVLGTLSTTTASSYASNKISCISIAFYLSIMMSIIYIILAYFFVYRILQTKYVKGLNNPSVIWEEIMTAVEKTKDYSCEQQILSVSMILLEKINFEMENINKVMGKNRFYYTKFLNASFLSLGCSVCSLLFVNMDIFNNNNIYLALLLLFSYALLLGIFVIIFIPHKPHVEKNNMK